MAAPTINIKDLLVTNSVGTFASQVGWGIYIGKEPDKPDSVITLYDSGGENADPKWLLDFPHVQVRVRGSKGDYSGAYTKIKQCKDVLLGCPSLDLNGDRLVSFTSLGEINFLSYDQNERPLFTYNLRLIVQPAVPATTNRQSLL